MSEMINLNWGIKSLLILESSIIATTNTKARSRIASRLKVNRMISGQWSRLF
jgi:hypothetical protein